jgi:hypothetical protein
MRYADARIDAFFADLEEKTHSATKLVFDASQNLDRVGQLTRDIERELVGLMEALDRIEERLRKRNPER